MKTDIESYGVIKQYNAFYVNIWSFMFLALTTFSMFSEDNIRIQIDQKQYQMETSFKLELKSPFCKIPKINRTISFETTKCYLIMTEIELIKVIDK